MFTWLTTTTFRRAAVHRSRRIALATLLDIEPWRLDDLGINQQDVVEALRARDNAGRHLDERRETRAAPALANQH